jgi:osmotically-inducible protein OsmY
MMDSSKLLRTTGTAAAAAVATYLLDPTMGRSRRARLADQWAARARRSVERAEAKARYQQGLARGAIHRISAALRRDGLAIDDDILLQKVRSEAVGRWDGPGPDIEIDVDHGVVTLKGPSTPERVDELLRLVEKVRGVESVNTEPSGP